MRLRDLGNVQLCVQRQKSRPRGRLLWPLGPDGDELGSAHAREELTVASRPCSMSPTPCGPRTANWLQLDESGPGLSRPWSLSVMTCRPTDNDKAYKARVGWFTKALVARYLQEVSVRVCRPAAPSFPQLRMSPHSL